MARSVFFRKTGLGLMAFAFGVAGPPSASPYVNAATSAAAWIDTMKYSQTERVCWATDDRTLNVGVTDLYTGNAGIVLFYLELYRATGKRAYLAEAECGARYLTLDLARVVTADVVDGVTESRYGLYTGNAGVAFTLLKMFKATNETRYKDAVENINAVLVHEIEKHHADQAWLDSDDVTLGGSGIGLYLLTVHQELKTPELLHVAEVIGRHLIQSAHSTHDGLDWVVDPTKHESPSMPNFSHGTAGVCYFLARLFEVTHDPQYLKAALDGAHYLESIESEQCLIYHTNADAGGKHRYYLGTCHGPAGTGRFFYLLWMITGDEKWLIKIKKSAEAVMTSGLPEQQTPGFWNNVSMCCGSAGLIQYFGNLYQTFGDASYLAFAKRLAANLLSRATPEGKGLKWVQAEHRIHPDLLMAQTGYMQGAAGIGTAILHLDAIEKKQPVEIILPDSPFQY